MKTKYRAWDDKSGQYIHVGWIDFVNGEIEGLPFEIQECQDSITIKDIKKLEQFTGLLTADDRKEIYEGDIVRMHQFLFDGNECEAETIGSIEYDDEIAAFGLKIIKFDQRFSGNMGIGDWLPLYHFYGLHEESWEIIGNIHDLTPPAQHDNINP
jgi:uncharacterized phage protein (TIGR01671 family)